MSRARQWLQPRRRDLLPDEELFSNLLYLPALDPIEWGGSKASPGAKTKPRMRQGHAHFAPTNKAVGGGAGVGGAWRAEEKEWRAGSYEQAFSPPRHSQEVAAVRNARNGNSISKV